MASITTSGEDIGGVDASPMSSDAWTARAAAWCDSVSYYVPCAAVALALMSAAGCAGRYISPLPPPPYRAEIAATYDATWRALVRAFAIQNVPVRAVARDSGVIASDDMITPIGLYADCGRLGDDRIEGEAVVSYTVFASAHGPATGMQVNSKMRTQAHRKGGSGKLKPMPVYQCASTGRFELNLLDTVRELVKE